MRCQKYLWTIKGLSVALCVELAVSLVTLPLNAQSIKVSLTFPPTENVGAPDRTVGGGVRRGAIPLTVVAPTNNLVTTVSDHPTLYWYVPETRAKSAELVISDNQGKKIHQTSFAVNGTPGIVKLSLPATVGLKIGEQYKWTLTLIDHPENPSENDLERLSENQSVTGLLKRTQLNSEQKRQLAAAKEPLKRADIYAQAGVWQETLTILDQLRHDRPNDAKVTEAWQQLLQSVRLNAIATAPLIDCCTAVPANP